MTTPRPLPQYVRELLVDHPTAVAHIRDIDDMLLQDLSWRVGHVRITKAATWQSIRNPFIIKVVFSACRGNGGSETSIEAILTYIATQLMLLNNGWVHIAVHHRVWGADFEVVWIFNLTRCDSPTKLLKHM